MSYSAYLVKQNQPRPDCAVKRLWCYKGTDKRDNFDFDWRNEWPRVRLNSESPVFVSEHDANSVSLGGLSGEVDWVVRWKRLKFLVVRQNENVDSIAIDNLVLQSDLTDFPKWTNPFPVAVSLIHWNLKARHLYSLRKTDLRNLSHSESFSLVLEMGLITARLIFWL